jgi:flagellar motor switch protein FliM
MTDTSSISKLAIAGGRGRAAAEKLATASADFATALRRALPFLARRRTAITVDPPAVALLSDLRADASIVHVTTFLARPANSAGVLAIDGGALGCILDGVLGAAEGSSPPIEMRLTSAQAALASRVSASLLRALSDALAKKLGISLDDAPAAAAPDGAAVVATITIEGGGRVVLAVPLSAVSREESAPPQAVDSGIAAAMIDVELDVVAELGKVRLSLEVLARLSVGDVLRLPLSVDERARVSAGGAVLFHGRPTAVGETVAIAIERSANAQAPLAVVTPIQAAPDRRAA